MATILPTMMTTETVRVAGSPDPMGRPHQARESMPCAFLPCAIQTTE